MTRILIHVEGQTEERFVNDLLSPHLYKVGYTSVGARLLGNSRARSKRGGIRNWDTVSSEIEKHLRHDGAALAGLMVDYYALPAAWPGRTTAVALPIEERGRHVEAQLLADFHTRTGLGDRVELHVLMHEFEALLFSDCHAFANAIGHPGKAAHLHEIASQFPTPEHINDSPNTAPSKRVLRLIPGYQKPLFGVTAALSIGLDTIRASCANFSDWVGRLETRVL